MHGLIRITALIAVIMGCTACGTARTVAVGDGEAVSISSGGKSTRCDSIPRVYSGVSYNFCFLNTPHGAVAGDNRTNDSIRYIPGVFIDFILSGAMDTVALPWTIYRQSTLGNIHIEK